MTTMLYWLAMLMTKLLAKRNEWASSNMLVLCVGDLANMSETYYSSAPFSSAVYLQP